MAYGFGWLAVNSQSSRPVFRYAPSRLPVLGICLVLWACCFPIAATATVVSFGRPHSDRFDPVVLQLTGWLRFGLQWILTYGSLVLVTRLIRELWGPVWARLAVLIFVLIAGGALLAVGSLRGEPEQMLLQPTSYLLQVARTTGAGLSLVPSSGPPEQKLLQATIVGICWIAYVLALPFTPTLDDLRPPRLPASRMALRGELERVGMSMADQELD